MPDHTSPAPNDAYGELADIDGRSVIRFVREYPVSRPELWSAITEPDRTERWGFRSIIEPRTGGTINFELGEAGSPTGTVIEWDEPAALEYKWAFGDMEWQIRFELTEIAADSTRLVFDHILPTGGQAEFSAGWHWHLDRLETHLRGEIPAQVDSDEHFDALLASYEAAADGN